MNFFLCNIASKTYITKANGHRVQFNENKILSTCRRAGADKQTAQRIVKKVKSQIYQGIGTDNIYKLVLRAINEEKGGRALHQRYKLKEAIMKSVGLLKTSSFDQISEVINQAMKLGLDNDHGYDYLIDFE